MISADEPSVHGERREQILQAGSAVAGTVELPFEYREYSDVFAESGAAELPEHGPSDHAIDLMNEKQPPYGPIDDLNELELET